MTEPLDTITPSPADRPGLVDRFIHASLFDNSDILLRARVLVVTMLVSIGVTVSAFLLQILLTVDSATRIAGIPIDLFLITMNTYLLLQIRHHGRYLFAAKVFIVMVFSIMVLAVAITGGIVVSPITQMLAYPPLLAYLLCGTRWGSGIIAATALVALVMLLLQLGGFVFPQTIAETQILTVQAMVFTMLFLLVAAQAFLYEFVSTRLKQELDDKHRQIVILAQTDPLTGVANRRNFDTLVEDRIREYRAKGDGRGFSLCFIDLDAFKGVNDRYGHTVGDEVLLIAAKRLRSALRNNDHLCRQGGDEFILFLDRVDSDAVMTMLARRITATLQQPMHTSAGELQIGCSLGFASYPTHGDSLDNLKKAADHAMYRAKREGGGWAIAGGSEPA